MLFNVTSAILARNLPLTVEPPLSVIDWSAITVPTKVLPVPKVAEEGTYQKTLHA